MGSTGPFCIAEDNGTQESEEREEGDPVPSLRHITAAERWHWHQWHFHYPAMEVPPPAVAADAFENDENDDVVEDGDTECAVAPIPPLFQTVTIDHWPEYQQQIHCPHKDVTPLAVPTHEEVMAGENKEEDM